jgi:putative transposase
VPYIVLTGRPRHLETFDYLGLHRYFLTFCTHSRRALFNEPRLVDLVLSQMLRAARDEQFAVVAYCFMPDHVHLLVEGQADTSDCLRFIKGAKQYSGYHYSKIIGDRLWQRYGFERVLRNDEATLAVAKYTLENPLRAGVVNRVEDYPFVGSATHTLQEILAWVAD